MIKCSDCNEVIEEGEPVLVTEFYRYKDGQKEFLGRQIIHAEGYGCMVDEGKITYPRDTLPPWHKKD